MSMNTLSFVGFIAIEFEILGIDYSGTPFYFLPGLAEPLVLRRRNQHRHGLAAPREPHGAAPLRFMHQTGQIVLRFRDRVGVVHGRFR